MEAKRKALEGIVSKPAPAPQAPEPTEYPTMENAVPFTGRIQAP
jgi:hypothetical protein